ncbi:MAG: branched-chain-amino-acid transaminase [Actinobacteria bacterium]|nr:branched-chain-amino-acid transaminase [Actinomycetota bacterium]
MADKPFGSVISDRMTVSVYEQDRFNVHELVAADALPLHPAAHVLHYGSACFEGLKAHRGSDGVVRLFRLDRHAERMRISADLLCLPDPPAELLTEMVRDTVRANLDDVPDPPGALYLRPVLIGTEPNIGAAARAARTALLYVIASPVGDYFDSSRTLTVAIETQLPRTTPQFGQVKTGANYAMALGITRQAAERYGADQVLFAPDGDVQETGAANFMMIDGNRIVTRALDSSFLHGVTRDSVLTIAREQGYDVEERNVGVPELVERTPQVEMALSGTAAVLAPVGALVLEGQRLTVGDGSPGPNTTKLRETLQAVQRAETPDRWGWTTEV